MYLNASNNCSYWKGTASSQPESDGTLMELSGTNVTGAWMLHHKRHR